MRAALRLAEDALTKAQGAASSAASLEAAVHRKTPPPCCPLVLSMVQSLTL